MTTAQQIFTEVQFKPMNINWKHFCPTVEHSTAWVTWHNSTELLVRLEAMTVTLRWPQINDVNSRLFETTPLRPLRSLRNPQRDFAGNVQRLSLFRPQPHLQSFIQIHPSFRDILAKTTFQIITIIGDPIGIRPIGSPIIKIICIRTAKLYVKELSHNYTFVC